MEDRHDTSSQDFDGSQHLLMRQRRDTHLERDARDAADADPNRQRILQRAMVDRLTGEWRAVSISYRYTAKKFDEIRPPCDGRAAVLGSY